ncbi:MAG: Gfo/Idh/MocA family oxidoreductase [Armatimonadetes bacterium]|nr:Gfo/Idh/MocA family oxidoreductase [Armatimonadota bacterium]
MIRVGMISAASYAPTFNGDDVPRKAAMTHGPLFTCAFNGHDPAQLEAHAGEGKFPFNPIERRFDDVRAVKIWDPLREAAEHLAAIVGIDEVCDTPEQCTEGVDAVIIPDDGSGCQYKYAVAALEKGLPTFVDKPLAMTAREAKQIAQVAKGHNAPLMSASSLRFVPDIVALRDEVRSEAFGDVNLASVAGGGDPIWYGIHALSMAYGVFEPGAVSCVNVGVADRNVVRVRYASGRDLMLIVGQAPQMCGGYQINVYGTKGWKSVTPSLQNLYIYLMERFLALVREGEVSVPVDEEVEVIAVLEAGQRSLAEGREVTIAEMLE